MSNTDKLMTKHIKLLLRIPDNSFVFNQENCQRNDLINESSEEELRSCCIKKKEIKIVP